MDDRIGSGPPATPPQPATDPRPSLTRSQSTGSIPADQQGRAGQRPPLVRSEASRNLAALVQNERDPFRTANQSLRRRQTALVAQRGQQEPGAATPREPPEATEAVPTVLRRGGRNVRPGAFAVGGNNLLRLAPPRAQSDGDLPINAEVTAAIPAELHLTQSTRHIVVPPTGETDTSEAASVDIPVATAVAEPVDARQDDEAHVDVLGQDGVVVGVVVDAPDPALATAQAIAVDEGSETERSDPEDVPDGEVDTRSESGSA